MNILQSTLANLHILLQWYKFGQFGRFAIDGLMLPRIDLQPHSKQFFKSYISIWKYPSNILAATNTLDADLNTWPQYKGCWSERPLKSFRLHLLNITTVCPSPFHKQARNASNLTEKAGSQAFQFCLLHLWLKEYTYWGYILLHCSSVLAEVSLIAG